jgi:tetratricopeptide (TPR) repeat protein
MPEPISYPGSPSLSAEAREKVLQTFRHTLDMARAGRNEDALLGCDFILKMDARFAPARRLLSSLRGIAAGTVINLADFDVFGSVPPAARPAQAPAPVVVPAAGPATPAAGWAVPAAPPPSASPFGSTPSGLDDLGFEDLGPDPFASPAPADPSFPEAPASSPSLAFKPDAPGADSFGALAPELSFSEAPSPAVDPFASPSSTGGPFAAPAPASDAFALPEPSADLFGTSNLPADPFTSPAPVLPFPDRGPVPGSVAPADPRISQFLRQGDDAAARGHLQEAIDLWSRVFLIDLSNDEASRRIDAAREKQSEAARQLDVLLTEGVQRYEAGDLQSARDAFLQVLTLSESDATARNYLNQIDAVLAVPSTGAVSSSAASLPDAPYMGDELESPGRPSFADDLPSLDERREDPGLAGARIGSSRRETEAPVRRGGIDGRVLIGVAVLVLVGVAAAAWFLFRPKGDAPPATAAVVPPAIGAPSQKDPLEEAQTLFKQGKVDDALGILTAIPSSDPRHDQALVLIDQFKSSAEPRPSTGPAVSDAQVDEARLAGLASLSSGRYIDAVKSLDLVVKARPDDAEAAQALSRARDSVSALGSAIRSYNEQDYESALRLLWDLRKQDPKNKDVEEYLFKSYFNDGILNLQSGGTKKAGEAFREAAALRPQDAETQRHLKFARRYAGGTSDLLARIYVKHVSPRP